METELRSKHGRRRGLTALAAVMLVGVTLAPSVPGRAGADAGLPTTFAGRTEGTAVRYGIGAVSTFVDPGTAYTFAKADSVPNEGFDASQGGVGDRRLDMKAVGANVDPGTLTAAVIWAASSPIPPETGMNEARGFPFYTEGFFPTPDGQSARSEKCTLNKDAKPSPECNQANAAMYSSGVVVYDKDGPDGQLAPSSRGFARSAGTDQGDLRIGDTFSEAYVGPDGKGGLISRHHAEGRDITIAGTPIVVNFSVSSQVLAAPDGVKPEAHCEAVMTIAGQTFTTPDEIKQALAQFNAGTQNQITFTPPTDPVINNNEVGGAEASCDGARISMQNPQSGVRYTYLLGTTYAVAAPLGKSLGDASSPGAITVDDSSASSGLSDTSVSDTSSGDFTTASPEELAAPAPDSAAAGGEPSVDTPKQASSSGNQASGNFQAAPAMVEKPFHPLPIAAATAGAGVVLLLGVWLLVGVVGALGSGKPFRLPGL